jgi:thymidylate synthase ThyX
MMFDSNLRGKLVYSPLMTQNLLIPEEMGIPRNNQMQGTLPERLSELASRICYDSLGKGRSSEDFHKHLLEVEHFSVYEHYHFTVFVQLPSKCVLEVFNRKGMWVVFPKYNDDGVRITFNLRHILDWDKTPITNERYYNSLLYNTLLQSVKPLAPKVLGHLKHKPETTEFNDSGMLVTPTDPHEVHLSVYLSGSRGFSHEQVRHRFNMSQRSTRYVDESESDWVEHPLLSKYLSATGATSEKFQSFVDASRDLYEETVASLEAWLIKSGVDKFTARKQSRGASRGFLGNALFTELIFTASLADWQQMIRARCSSAADAEIRVLYSNLLRNFKSGLHKDDFAHFELAPSPDRIGDILVEK